MEISLFTIFSLASWLFSLGSARSFRRRLDDSLDITYAGCDDSVYENTETICGAIVCDANYGWSYFYASDALECLATVPFNADVALRFIDYYNTTMQFQSTLAYLRDPPPGYQQPSVDFFQELADIKKNATEGKYANEYAFETDVMRLVYLVHDSHVSLYSGALSAFTFGSDYQLVTASIDGNEVPKVYMQTDVLAHRDTGATISPVATIDGVDAVQFLTEFAARNSPGMLEPHADWNQLMASPVQGILDTYDVFSTGATFYPGDNLTITFENGTAPIDDNWIAIYTNSEFTGPLSTGGDFYNYFVLDLLPASYDNATLPDVFNYSSAIFEGDYGNWTLTDWSDTTYGAYPSNPYTIQANLSTGGLGGYVTGYLLDDISTGVLSIPSFDQYGDDVDNFFQAARDFVDNMTLPQNNVQKIIIDLQGNSGGNIFLALTTFYIFFPNLEQLTESRRRIHPLADVVGNATTQWWSELPSAVDTGGDDTTQKFLYAADEWVVTDRLDAETSQNFSSWSEYRGTVSDHGDLFSLVERYDLHNAVFQSSFFDRWYFNFTISPDQPPSWQPSDIILLTDGICGSACALFVELMNHQAGVRSIAIGGRPEAGPMQAASGTRGAIAYSGDELDVDFLQTNNITDDATVSVLPALDDSGYRDTGIAVLYAGFTLRDQVRSANASAATPLQFSYLAADCRLYYTLANVYNMSQLWRDTHMAAWIDPSLCVANSTGYSATGNTTTAVHAPPAATATAVVLPDLEFYANVTDTLASASDRDRPPSTTDVRPCKTSSDCGKWTCYHNVEIKCGGTKPKTSLCLPRCDSYDEECPSKGNLQCQRIPGSDLEVSQNSVVGGRGQVPKPQKSQSKKSSKVCIPDSTVDVSRWGLCSRPK